MFSLYSFVVATFSNRCVWHLPHTKVLVKEEIKEDRPLRTLVCSHTGGSRERPGDEEAGPVRVPGQRGDLHQPAGGPVAGEYILCTSWGPPYPAPPPRWTVSCS